MQLKNGIYYIETKKKNLFKWSFLIRNKIINYIRKWEKQGYPNGIPHEAPRNLEINCKVPSYRSICLAILSNDFALESLGYSREICESYNQLKRIELEARGVIKRKEDQLRFDL